MSIIALASSYCLDPFTRYYCICMFASLAELFGYPVSCTSIQSTSKYRSMEVYSIMLMIMPPIVISGVGRGFGWPAQYFGQNSLCCLINIVVVVVVVVVVVLVVVVVIFVALVQSPHFHEVSRS